MELVPGAGKGVQAIWLVENKARDFQPLEGKDHILKLYPLFLNKVDGVHKYL